MCEVGPIDCHTNATCLDRDGGYDCECNDGYTGNGTHCEGVFLVFFINDFLYSAIFAPQILMNVQQGTTVAILMLHVPTLMVVMIVIAFLVSVGMVLLASVRL